MVAMSSLLQWDVMQSIFIYRVVSEMSQEVHQSANLGRYPIICVNVGPSSKHYSQWAVILHSDLLLRIDTEQCLRYSPGDIMGQTLFPLEPAGVIYLKNFAILPVLPRKGIMYL